MLPGPPGGDVSDFVAKALRAAKESRPIDFKSGLDFEAPHTWPELVKDLVAMANSHGGVVLVGLDDSGAPSHSDVTAVLNLDSAAITDQVHKYTGIHFEDFEISRQSKKRGRIAAIEIGPAEIPIVFTRPGTYAVDGKHKTAFSRGTVYFRHGAKSDPGTTRDLERFFERRVNSVRKAWFAGMRKVTQAPPDASIVTLLPGQEIVLSSSPGALPVRLTDDPNAPAYRNIDHDATHPYRRKELVASVRDRLPAAATLAPYDIQCVKQVYALDEDERFYHHPKYASPQYSEAFADWLVEQYANDASFFEEARRRVKEASQSKGDRPHPKQ